MIDYAILGAVILAALACVLAIRVIRKLRQIHRAALLAESAVRNLSVSLTQNLQQIELLSYELALERPLPPLRGWVASPDVLLALTHHVRRFKPSVVVECGSGASTLVLAQAAKLNGRGQVYSIEHDGEFAQQTRHMLEEYGVADWAEVIHAPLRQTEIAGERWEWYDRESLPETPPVDLLFIDGPPADAPKPLARYPAGPLLFPRLSPRGVVFADDTNRPGETEILRRWAREFPALNHHRHFCEKGCFELRPATMPEETPELFAASEPRHASAS